MNNTELLTVNTIRLLSAEGVEKAKSGHPGLPMGAAPMAYTLWARNMKFNSRDPQWPNRDRFILSAGHGSMLLYSLLHLFGYGLSVEDLQNFRQFGSRTPGHPEYGHTVGVEVTTGPLGQGIANGVGMAMAEAYKAKKFNRPGFDVVDSYTFVLSGDGCMMEGVASEAASLAGTLGLGKLIVLYDSNKITIEGGTDIAFREDVGGRFAAYGWQVLKVEDGTDVNAIDAAVKSAKAEASKPSLIIISTEIGYGSPKQGKASAHGEPLGAENLAAARKNLEWNYDKEFHVPEEVRAHLKQIIDKGSEYQKDWNSLLDKYAKAHPELYAEWVSWHSQDLTGLYDDEGFRQTIEKPDATRSSSGEVLNRLAKLVPNLIGGSADLAPSNKSAMKGRGDFLPGDFSGANLHFGVREHAMAAIANGMYLYGGLKVYVSTFFVFCDYMKPSMRLAALMGIPAVYILTHDSIGVGEDGPTHQPVEQLASLRSIPNFTVFRPADMNETIAGWYAAVTSKSSPTALVLTRQNLPQFKETGKDALKGAYILIDSTKPEPELILIASGSEVQLAYEAGKQLKAEGVDVRVVSMPSWELFERQSAEYKEKVFPSGARKRLAIEAGSSFGWQKYTGIDGAVISIDRFGMSAPAEIIFRELGYTVENVVKQAKELLK